MAIGFGSWNLEPSVCRVVKKVLHLVGCALREVSFRFVQVRFQVSVRFFRLLRPCEPQLAPPPRWGLSWELVSAKAKKAPGDVLGLSFKLFMCVGYEGY
jgi:hypothetical protein